MTMILFTKNVMWSGLLNMAILRVIETDLLYPTKQFVFTLEHERNPFKSEEAQLGRKKVHLKGDFGIAFMAFIAMLQLWTYLFLLEVVSLNSSKKPKLKILRKTSFNYMHKKVDKTSVFILIAIIVLSVTLHKIGSSATSMDFGIVLYMAPTMYPLDIIFSVFSFSCID